MEGVEPSHLKQKASIEVNCGILVIGGNIERVKIFWGGKRVKGDRWREREREKGVKSARRFERDFSRRSTNSALSDFIVIFLLP